MSHETLYQTAEELENESLVSFDEQRTETVKRFLLEELVA
jgi:hypothetical protein